jgi:hypothetical protein
LILTALALAALPCTLGVAAAPAAVTSGTATRILGADAYQTAGEPSRVFLSGASGPPGLDEARRPGQPVVPDCS